MPLSQDAARLPSMQQRMSLGTAWKVRAVCTGMCGFAIDVQCAEPSVAAEVKSQERHEIIRSSRPLGVGLCKSVVHACTNERIVA